MCYMGSLDNRAHCKAQICSDAYWSFTLLVPHRLKPVYRRNIAFQIRRIRRKVQVNLSFNFPPIWSLPRMQDKVVKKHYQSDFDNLRDIFSKPMNQLSRMARWNRPLACEASNDIETLALPALSPAIVTKFAFPPKGWMCFGTQRRPSIWSALQFIHIIWQKT